MICLYNTPSRMKKRLPSIKVLDGVVDDFGDLVLARCRYTGEMFRAADGVVRGATMPNVKDAYLDSRASTQAHAADRNAFAEMDRNCNTCQRLVRLPFDKDYYRAGLMPGQCDMFGKTHPYYRGEFFLFPPDDAMLMECWEIRNQHRGDT